MSADLASRTSHRDESTSRQHLTFGGAVSSEWIKLRTLRSTWWVAAGTVVLLVLIALLSSWTFSSFADDPEFAAQTGGGMFDSLELVTSGVSFGQLVLAVLGVLVITNEFSSGMIRSTFAADPGRSATVWAKALVLALVSVVVAAVGIALSYAVAYPFLANADMAPDLGGDDSWRILGGAVVFLVLTALMALGIGTLLRSTAGAIFTIVALNFVAPPILGLINNDIVETINKFLPANAGQAFMTTSDLASGGIDLLEPAQGLLVAIAWAVVPLVAANVVIKARDA
ncbi:ABC transporter permease [Paraoerskovia sediminicola]|uniref:ABC transporter permease n=1 Tax=Paraoerskovia sediminicola TaxID=1138587 RepID=A0ABM8G403_9CELL|nr:ABC transporter permease subunit [Paraoerskovia sediminicola]BDZ42767.1 ABC transporter permease [Paraoerskovia sediminicola]